MNNEQLEEGISIGELFAIVWKRKVIIAAITMIVTIITVLTVALFVNPRSISYESTFELSFPGISENKYPSGSRFNFKDIISDENVEYVIENSEGKLNYIDIDKFQMIH